MKAPLKLGPFHRCRRVIMLSRGGTACNVEPHVEYLSHHFSVQLGNSPFSVDFLSEFKIIQVHTRDIDFEDSRGDISQHQSLYRDWICGNLTIV